MVILGHPVQLGSEYRHDPSADSQYWPSGLRYYVARNHESCCTASVMTSTISALEVESCSSFDTRHLELFVRSSLNKTVLKIRHTNTFIYGVERLPLCCLL